MIQELIIVREGNMSLSDVFSARDSIILIDFLRGYQSVLAHVYFIFHCVGFQCFDAVGWAAGRASGL